MARATTAPSSHHHRPPNAMVAAAAVAKAKAKAPPPTASAASLVPHRRATATARGAFSRRHHHHQPQPHPHPHHHRRVTPPVVIVAPRPRPGSKHRASCACSPTTHPGSYRCALHRGGSQQQGHASAGSGGVPVLLPAAAPVSSRLSLPRRASMANPLVRIAAVEGGDHIRRALAALVRPLPSQTTPRRRGDASFFGPTPSRLSVMSSAAAPS